MQGIVPSEKDIDGDNNSGHHSLSTHSGTKAK